jgi:hypothetical protein
MPGPWHQVLIFDRDLICLDVPHLLGVLVEQDNGGVCKPVEELNVKHLQLLQPNVEGVFELSFRVDRNDLEESIVQVQAYQSPLLAKIPKSQSPAVLTI